MLLTNIRRERLCKEREYSVPPEREEFALGVIPNSAAGSSLVQKRLYQEIFGLTFTRKEGQLWLTKEFVLLKMKKKMKKLSS